MIGHYLNVQNQAAEDRVLLGVMGPGELVRSDGITRCLLGTIENWTQAESVESPIVSRARRPRLVAWAPRRYQPDSMRHHMANQAIPYRYDRLCERFGNTRVNAAIRNRILSNQARRVLTPEHEYAMVLR